MALFLFLFTVSNPAKAMVERKASTMSFLGCETCRMSRWTLRKRGSLTPFPFGVTYSYNPQHYFGQGPWKTTNSRTALVSLLSLTVVPFTVLLCSVSISCSVDGSFEYSSTLRCFSKLIASCGPTPIAVAARGWLACWLETRQTSKGHKTALLCIYRQL
jgi:hypothetical protein